MISPEFLITAFIIVLAPGTGVVYTVATGLGRGRLASAAAATGCTAATVLHLAAALMGIAAILHASAELFQLVKLAGVAYLVYLAVQTLRDRGPLRFEADQAPVGLARTAWTGFVINILNPKISIFFIAFLPQFMSADASHAVVEVLMLGSVFVGLTFAVFVVYGQIASVIRDRVLSSRRAMDWVRRIVAATFAAFAVRLALSER